MQGWREDGAPSAVVDVERLIVHGRFGNPGLALRELAPHLPPLEHSLDPEAWLIGLYARALLMRFAGATRVEVVAAWTRLEGAAAERHLPAWVAIACAMRARTRLEMGEPAAAMGDLARIDLEALADEFDSVTGFRLLDATASAFSRIRMTDRADQARQLLEESIGNREALDQATHWATWAAELATRAMEPVARGAAEPEPRLLDRAVELSDRVLALGVSPVPEPLRRMADGVRALSAGYRGQPTEALRLLGSDAFGEPLALQPPEAQLLVIAALHAHTLVGSHATARSLDDSIARSLGALPSIVLEVCRARERLWLEREAGGDTTRVSQRLNDLLVRLAWQSMELVSETARQAMEHQVLHTESRTDALTGVGNRRALDEELNTMLRFTELPVGMVLLDLDDFKRVNDEYTHLIGDAVLREVAGCVADLLGPTDRLVRYGGDEFVVLLAGAGDSEARLAAERMAAAIHTIPWDAVAAGLRVRVTTGSAALYALTGRRPAADAERLFRRADESLLEAKRSARRTEPVTDVLDLREVALITVQRSEPVLGEDSDAQKARHAVGPREDLDTGEVLPARRPGRRAAVIDLTDVQERAPARE
ncbi:MAG: GGDEF domain-containing protein [Kineosporiaceae bacterium]